MKQLSGLDAGFLYMEAGGSTYGHVNGLGIYKWPDNGLTPYEAVYQQIQSRVALIEPLRRRLVEVPFGLDHPYWVEDPNFDLDFHIRHIAIPAPGSPELLAEQVARIIGRQMDRTRPLWEVYVMEGLENDEWALLSKFHHATVDGAAGVLLLTMLLDTDPAAELPPGQPWRPTERFPTDVEVLTKAASGLVRMPVKAARAQLKFVQQVAQISRSNGVATMAGAARSAIKNIAGKPSSEPGPVIPLRSAPQTPFNRPITPHRRFSMRTTDLGDVKRIKEATGCTVNDVVMAVCSGALREYLIRHDALPHDPLVAMVPVSIRTGSEADPWTNRVSSLFVQIPTNCDDPLERVRMCHDAMQAAKGQLELVPASVLVDLTETASPVLAASAARLASRLHLGDRFTLPANVVISNVPGPRQPLYLRGMQMQHYVPVSTIADGMGLNITVHSYLDKLDFGLVADRQLVPDLWDLVDLHLAEVGNLLAAVAPPRRRAKRASAKPAAAKAR